MYKGWGKGANAWNCKKSLIIKRQEKNIGLMECRRTLALQNALRWLECNEKL
jgi:hypothetical protein